MEKRKDSSKSGKALFLGWLRVVSVFLLFLGAKHASAAEEEAFVPSSIPAPEFSVEAGFYEVAFDLVLTAPEGTTVYYTLDGSEPVAGFAEVYTEPISIDAFVGRKGTELLQATVVRAVAVTADEQYSDIQTHTYFVTDGMKEWYQVPVVSLVTDPASLYDEKTGIYANPKERGREWEREAHFEYFLPDGTRELSLNVGIRIHGAYSRGANIKSFRVYARSEYDTQKNFNYDFFSSGLIPAVEKNGEEKNIEKFKRILLRTGGNEGDAWDATYFRDILAQSLMADTKLDLQSYQPTVTYINGEFYGILNIQERMDDRYLASHYNCQETEVAIYEFEYNKDADGEVILPSEGQKAFEVVVDEGPEEEKTFFDEAFDFVTTNDMSDAAMYEKAQEYFDIENFIDYLCLQLYSGNGDWPHNNCQAWRYIGTESEEYGLDGKIRWLVFDMDFAFGLYGHSSEENELSLMVADYDPEDKHRDVLSGLFRALLKNDGFKEQFKARFRELLATNFAPENVLVKLESLEEKYAPLVVEQYLKYGAKFDYSENIDRVRQYATLRADIVDGYLDWSVEESAYEAWAKRQQQKAILRSVCIVIGVLFVGSVVFFGYRRRKRKDESRNF